MEHYEFRKLKTNRSIDFGRNPFIKDRVFRVKNGDQVLYIFYQREKISETGWMLGIILAAAILFLIFLTYLALRWVLQPVHWLSGGVEALAQGQLEHRVRCDRHDEFGRLARGFNRMAERISTMLSARKQLLLDVSHELRSPITRMKVALEMMPGDALRKNLEEDLLMLESMVTEILETSRLESQNSRLNFHQLDVVKMVKNVLGHYSEGKPEIVLKESPESLELEADPEQLRIVLENLLNNARRFSDDASIPIQVSIVRGEDQAVLSVRDYGVGIATEEQNMIFEPFYQIDKSRFRDSNHYGLGLNLCRTIIEAHDGNLRVESKEGLGSTFFLEIPMNLQSKD